MNEYKVPKLPTSCAYGCSLTFDHLQTAINLAGLTWHIPTAQYHMLQCLYLTNVTEIRVEYSSDQLKQLMTEHQPSALTLLGIPVSIDDSLPNTVVQLRYKGLVIWTIESLSVPMGYDN